MPIPHLNIRIVQRSKGSSAVAGAAYQAGEKLFSEYDQKNKDHRRKQKEVQPLKDVRYWISKVIEPEQGEVEKKPEPKHSVTEKMKYLQEQKKQLEPKSPQHKQKKQNMEL